jgi:hypothetical protein
MPIAVPEFQSKYIGIGWRRTTKGQCGWYTQHNNSYIGGLVGAGLTFKVQASKLVLRWFHTHSFIIQWIHVT